jgi:hypothetical protein
MVLPSGNAAFNFMLPKRTLNPAASNTAPDRLSTGFGSLRVVSFVCVSAT